MMGASHRLGGAALGMLAAGVLAGPDDMAGKAVVLSAAVLGSLIPDIDNARSSISRRYRGISMAVSIVQTLIRGISSLLPRKQREYIRGAAGHRGITHSPVMVAVCIILVHMGILVCPAWKNLITLAAWGVGVGIVSHLILDLFAGGIPLLFPFSLRRFALAHVKTGGPVEWIIRTLAAGLLVLLAGTEMVKWI